jgi:hypothetical protein
MITMRAHFALRRNVGADALQKFRGAFPPRSPGHRAQRLRLLQAQADIFRHR